MRTLMCLTMLLCVSAGCSSSTPDTGAAAAPKPEVLVKPDGTVTRLPAPPAN